MKELRKRRFFTADPAVSTRVIEMKYSNGKENIEST
jgi:hypothetical protein